MASSYPVGMVARRLLHRRDSGFYVGLAGLAPMNPETIAYIESVREWRDVLNQEHRYDSVIQYLRREHGHAIRGVEDDELLSYFQNRPRIRKIQSEQRLWTEAIQRYVAEARRAGYRVTSLDGAWRVETAKVRHELTSDAELFLFLVDRKVIKVKVLPHSRTVGKL